MKKMVENSKTARKRFENGSETARKRLVNVGRFLAVLLVLLTIGIGNAWGTEVTYTFTSASWGDSNSAWTSNTPGSDFESSSPERGVVNKDVSGECTSKSSFSGVYSISVMAAANGAGGAIKIKIGSTEIATRSIAQTGGTLTAYKYDFEDYPNMASLSGNINLSVTPPSNNKNSVWVKSITITYGTSAYTVTYNVGNGSCETATQTEAGNGRGVTLPSATPSAYYSAAGWVFAGWKRSSAQTETTNIPTLYKAGAEYHPSSSETLYAVYCTGDVYDVDFESTTGSYSSLTFTNMTSQQNTDICPRTGAYYGTTGGKATASITTNSKINPISIRFYVSRPTTNTTSSSWIVQTSEDGSEWTDGETQDATSMTLNTWTEVTQDLSSYSDVYVRVLYSGSTAARTIDDLIISCATYSSNPDCTYDFFVDEMHGNEIAAKQGTYSMPASPGDEAKGDASCAEEHYHFMGWVEDVYVNRNGTLKSGYTLYPAGHSGHTAASKTFYAIWAAEE